LEPERVNRDTGIGELVSITLLLSLFCSNRTLFGFSSQCKCRLQKFDKAISVMRC
jgi:hypothetical protein